MASVRELFKLSAIPVVIASLCCLSPLILLLVGFSTVAGAASLADVFYGQYKWWFRAAGLLALLAALIVYFRRQKGICTLDDAVRRKNEILNMVALTLIAGTVGYVMFLYVVVHYAGVFLRVWE